MRRSRRLALLATTASLLACGPVGSGEVVSERREVGGFDDIQVSGGTVGSVVVPMSRGSNVTVNVTDEIVGNASGGSDLTILGDPAGQRVDVSGGAEVRNE